MTGVDHHTHGNKNTAAKRSFTDFMRFSIRSACVVSARMEPMINAQRGRNPAHGKHNHCRHMPIQRSIAFHRLKVLSLASKMLVQKISTQKPKDEEKASFNICMSNSPLQIVD
jgi:hypothetical protein